MKATAALLAAILLMSCSQSDAPSEEMEKAAEVVVRAVEGAEEPEQLPQGPFAPRDECRELPRAAEFRRELSGAIAARDAEALVALAAEDIKLDFGGGSGKAELRRRLTAEDGELWERLAPLTQLGCAVNSQGGMTLPWYFEHATPADPYAAFIVTGENVPVHEAPDSAAPVIRRLSWDVVEAFGQATVEDPFRQVRLPAAGQGETIAVAKKADEDIDGFIAQEHLRSLIDYRLIAASRNNRWRIISLVAGD